MFCHGEERKGLDLLCQTGRTWDEYNPAANGQGPCSLAEQLFPTPWEGTTHQLGMGWGGKALTAFFQTQAGPCLTKSVQCMVKEWLPQNNWKNEWKQWLTQKHQAKNGLLTSNLDTYPVYVISPSYSPLLWKFGFNFCFQTFSALSLCAKTINTCDSCTDFDSTLVFKHLFGEAT